MESTNPVSYKSWVYCTGNSEPEIRRFGIDSGVSTNYSFLRQKLESLYPNLGSEYTVQWKDDDDDFVTISTDEELMEALINMRDVQDLNVMQIHVSQKNSSAEQNYNMSEGKLHPHVVCDVCDGEVRGYRYKCMQCPDYDLCFNCEKSGHHHEHNMMRIVSPTEWPHFGQRFWGGRGHRGFRPWHHRSSGRGCHRSGEGFNWHGFPGGGCAWGMFDNMWSGWQGQHGANTEQQQKEENKKEGSKQEQESGAAGGPETAGGPGTASGPGTAGGPEATGGAVPPAEFLKNVGDFVANLLDPLGIDVDIGVTTPESGVGKKQKKCKGKCRKHKDRSTEESEKMETCEDSSTETKPEPSTTEEAAAAEGVMEDEKHDSEEEWTVVKEEEEQKTDTPSQPTSGVYPTLSMETEQSSIPPGTDPHISHALEQMLSMGFQNEGGWLLQLLEAKGGDIGKVLDALKPVRY